MAITIKWSDGFTRGGVKSGNTISNEANIIENYIEVSQYECSYCGNNPVKWNDNYCSNCGVKFKWS